MATCCDSGEATALDATMKRGFLNKKVAATASAKGLFFIAEDLLSR
jgi:hypothetical protein